MDLQVLMTFLQKYISDIIAIPLSYIFQLSLTQGCFPNEFKVAKKYSFILTRLGIPM